MHRFQASLLGIVLIVFLSALASASVTVTVTDPNGGEIITQRDGNYSIDFNVVTDESPYNLSAYLYYSATAGSKTNLIVSALTLNASVCDDANFSDSTHCSWDWNSAGVNGTYYLDARAINLSSGHTGDDSSNSSFAVDNNSPLIYNYSPSGGWSNSSIVSAYLTDFESDINTATIVFNVEGSNYTTATTPAVAYNSSTDQATLDVNSLGFSPGQTIDINVDAQDLAGNPASQVYWNYAIDNNAPHAAIVNNEISTSWINNDTFSISCQDNESGCNSTKWYYFDDDGVCPINTKTNYVNSTTNNYITVNTDANSFVCLWVEDNAGNHDTDTSLPTKLRVDGTVPQTSHDAVSGWTTDRNVSLSADDFGLFDINVSGIARIDYNINSNTFTATNDSNNQPFTFNVDFNQGANAFSFSAVDRAGNVETPTAFDVNVDYTAPINPDINIANNAFWTNDAQPDLDLYAFDGESSISGMKFSCDGSSWTNWLSYSTTYTDFNMLDSSYGCQSGQGNKRIYVQFRDDANNLSSTVYDDIGFDSINPTTTRTPTTNWNSWQNTNIDVNFSCSDPSGSDFNHFEYFIDGNPFTLTSNPGQLSISSDGNHYVVFYCVDKAGNHDNNQSFYAPVDKSAPSTTWDGNNTWQSFDANIHLTCNDSYSGCNQTFYRLDSDTSSGITWGGWQAYSNNILVSIDGNLSIQFYSIDNIGNTETPDQNAILIDKTSPIAPTLNLPAGLNQNFVYVTWSGASDSGSGLRANNRYTVWHRDSNSSLWVPLTNTNSSDYNHTGLAKDTGIAHCYKIQVYDNLNFDANSNEDCVWLDSVAPVVNSFTASVSGKNVTLNYNVSDTNGSGIQVYYVRKDSDSWINNGTNTSYVFNNLANGTYTFYLRATDNANNTSNDANTNATVNYTPSPPTPPTPSTTGGGSPGGGSIYLPPSPTPDNGTSEPETPTEPQTDGGVSIDLCGGINCDDNNPCTNEHCSAGSCVYSNVLNGTPCGETGQCSDGVCVQPEATPETPQTGPTGFLGMGESLALGIGILALLIGAYSYLRKRGLGKGKEKPAESKFYYDGG